MTLKPGFKLCKMKTIRKSICVLVLCGSCFSALFAQETIPATGGNASGTGGSSSYSIGQVFFNTISGSNITVAQGVQQPFEISVVTVLPDFKDISLECIVYPNPTSGSVKLLFGSFDVDSPGFRLYDAKGVLLQDKSIVSRETEISMENLPSSVYYLKVLSNKIEIKVFKIVKR
jgi:hypothetical protein